MKDKKEKMKRVRAWEKANIEKVRLYKRQSYYRRTYGISLEECERGRIQRAGKCDICNKKAKLHLDHSHKTNALRGFLCFNCNAALGLFKDNAKTIQQALNYLERQDFSNSRLLHEANQQ